MNENSHYLLLPEEILLQKRTSPAVAAIASRPLGVLNYDPLSAQLLPVQVIHGIVGIPGVIEFDEPVPAGNICKINQSLSSSRRFLDWHK